MPLYAGARDRRITIQRATSAPNALNEPVLTWTDLATVWAEKFDVSDGERLQASEVDAEITTRFRILWSSQVADVNPKDRVSYAGRLYDIWGVKEIGTREGIEITATARADG
jgi:SPP1 family predicted phage head-tail adaptor